MFYNYCIRRYSIENSHLFPVIRKILATFSLPRLLSQCYKAAENFFPVGELFPIPILSRRLKIYHCRAQQGYALLMKARLKSCYHRDGYTMKRFCLY